MNINASIIDQRVTRIAAELADDFAMLLNIKNDAHKVRSTAFTYLVVKTLLDLDKNEALDALTEGGSDFGVDAVDVSDVQDGEFTVTLFQGRRDQANLARSQGTPQLLLLQQRPHPHLLEVRLQRAAKRRPPGQGRGPADHQRRPNLQNHRATLNALNTNSENLDQALVLVRLYQLPDDGADLIKTITYATNSQNPVDLRDLRSNDERQRALQASMEDLGYHYRRQRSEDSFKPTDITSATAAEAVLSLWRRRPQQAKFMTREHFGKLYETIFTPQLNGAQVVIATLLFRMAENIRKRPPADAPAFVPYAGAFIAMLMGDALLADMKINVTQLDHRNFEAARTLVEANGETYAARAITRIADALRMLYGQSDVSLQRLSATFRRGDLLDFLTS